MSISMFRYTFFTIYNKDLFDAAGVAYPTNDMTWDAYADLAKSMTKEGVYGTHYHTWLSAVANWAVCDGVNTLADKEYDDLLYFYKLYLIGSQESDEAIRPLFILRK